jgi:hypothetical protein
MKTNKYDYHEPLCVKDFLDEKVNDTFKGHLKKQIKEYDKRASGLVLISVIAGFMAGFTWKYDMLTCVTLSIISGIAILEATNYWIKIKNNYRNLN